METEVLSKQKRIAPGSVIAIMAAALALLMIGSFLIGRYSIPLRQLMGIIVSNIIPAPLKEFFAVPQVWTERQEIVFLNIRLPRVLLSCMVGCCLATAGVSYQGVFQNPMAAPDILGASSGAAFGAALAILNGLSGYQITICAFASSLLSVAIVFLISGKTVGNKVLVLVLSGIMISSLFQAGTSFIKLVADPNNQLPAITYWLMGSLSGTQTREVNFAFWPMLVTTLYLILLSILIAGPIGVFAAIYLNEYAKPGKMTRFIQFAIENLAGIPSIIYGLFGSLFFVQVLKMRYSILAGACTMSIMLPITRLPSYR